MEVKHIYWFAYFDDSEPSVRYRGTYALQYLCKHNSVSYSIVYPGYKPRAILKFLFTYTKAFISNRKNTLIVFENIRTNRAYAVLLKLLVLCKPNTLYDIDDGDYLRFPPDAIQFFMKKSKACSVGSSELMNYTSRYNANTHMLTTPVIMHNKRKAGKNEQLTVGWIGYYKAHKNGLMQFLFPALNDIDTVVRLVILGADKPGQKEEIEEYFLNNRNVILDIPQTINWLDENWIYDRIKEFDIGVSPLSDTEFNKTKSAFKMKQYLSCGVPVLATRVGENSHFLQHGHNGFFCDNVEDFIKYINMFSLMDENEYQALVTNAIKSTLTFDMKYYCQTLMTIAGKTLN